MPRRSRIVLPHVPHHVVQRGNYGQSVFQHENDFKIYCGWFKEYAAKYHLDAYAYCLMTNHVHFIVEPKAEDSLARVFNTLHMRYAQYVHRRRKVTGHLWQGRFFSCLLDEVHLYRAIRYVERNPVRAKLVRRAWDYEWSSAKEHVGEGKQTIPLSSAFEMAENEWKEYLKEPDPEMANEIRLKTQRGLAIGTEKFIGELEKKLKRSLACLNPGRPKKEILEKGAVPFCFLLSAVVLSILLVVGCASPDDSDKRSKRALAGGATSTALGVATGVGGPVLLARAAFGAASRIATGEAMDKIKTKDKEDITST